MKRQVNSRMCFVCGLENPMGLSPLNVFRSLDGAGNWERVVNGISSTFRPMWVAASQRQSNTFCVGGRDTRENYRIYWTEDGGLTWTDISAGLPEYNGQRMNVRFLIDFPNIQ